MRQWNIEKAVSEEEVEGLLNDDWEPFGIEQSFIRGTTKSIYMWFKKAVKEPPSDTDEEKTKGGEESGDQ